MSKRFGIVTTLLALGATLALTINSYAHCQVPCGIYDDHARVLSMLEDAATVEKASKMIGELADKEDAQSKNQLVRWVSNKEIHAQRVIETICDYFLTQRVKADHKEYELRLRNHHTVILAAMKAKQNADASYGAALRKSIEAIAAYYPVPEHKH